MSGPLDQHWLKYMSSIDTSEATPEEMEAIRLSFYSGAVTALSLAANLPRDQIEKMQADVDRFVSEVRIIGVSEGSA